MAKKTISKLSQNKTQRTHKASLTKRKQSLDKRFKLQKKFIEDVFPILCTCGRCTSRATLNFKKLCFSWNELAKTCTTLKIETPAGKTNWERTSSIEMTPRPVLNQSISEYQSGSLKLVLEYE